MSDIKPCPFCRFTAHEGNKSKQYYDQCAPATIRIQWPWLSKIEYAVQCQNCETVGPLADSSDEAVSIWNEQQWEEVLEK